MLSQRIFLSGYRGSMCQARKKWVVSDVPNRKTCCDFYAFIKKKQT